MLKLRDQATAILTALRRVSGINTVGLLEGIDLTELRRPGVLPMAQLMLSVDTGQEGGRTVSARTSWTVLVTARGVDSGAELLGLVDDVLDALRGLQPVVGMRPLVPKKVEFVDRGSEAAAYALTFAAPQAADL